MGMLMQLHTGDVAPLVKQLVSFLWGASSSESEDESSSGQIDDGNDEDDGDDDDNAADHVGAQVQAPYCLLLGALVLLMAVSGAYVRRGCRGKRTVGWRLRSLVEVQ